MSAFAREVFCGIVLGTTVGLLVFGWDAADTTAGEKLSILYPMTTPITNNARDFESDRKVPQVVHVPSPGTAAPRSTPAPTPPVVIPTITPTPLPSPAPTSPPAPSNAHKDCSGGGPSAPLTPGFGSTKISGSSGQVAMPSSALTSYAQLRAACCSCVQPKFESLHAELYSSGRFRLAQSSAFITKEVADSLVGRGGDYIALGKWALAQKPRPPSNGGITMYPVQGALHTLSTRLMAESVDHPQGPYVLTRDNVYVTKSGVIFDDKALYMGHTNTCSGTNLDRVDGATSVDKVVLMSGRWGSGYFHFWIEHLARAVLMFDELAKDKDIRIHIGDREQPFMKPILSFLGLPTHIISGSYKAKRAFLPIPGGCGRQHPTVIVAFSRKVQEILAKTKPSKQHAPILVLQRDKASRRISNHNELIATVKERWPDRAVDTMVQDSIEHTAHAFNQAKIVIAPHGAGLSHMIFCRPGTIIVEFLTRPANDVNMCYAELASQLPLHYVGTSFSGSSHSGGMTVNIDFMKGLLKELSPQFDG